MECRKDKKTTLEGVCMCVRERHGENFLAETWEMNSNLPC